MMEDQGFNSGVKNECPSQPVGPPYPLPGYDGQPQPVGQPYPPPGYDGQPQPVGQPYPPPGYDGQPQPVGQPYPPPGYDGQPQPGFNYPCPPPYNTDVQSNGFPQQAQPQVFYIGLQAPAYIAQAPNFVSMHVAIVLSCVILWLCGIIFGLIAFILALVGENAVAGGDTVRAIRLRNASYGVSIAGCVAGVGVIIVFIIVLLL